MSISAALQTGVSALLANSTKVGNISDNIANANTDGYRRTFSQMVTTTAGGTGGNYSTGVRTAFGADITSDGTLRATGRQNDLAINGPGFFVVSKNPNETLQSNFMLTRAGSFVPDEKGNLRNAAGLYLAGFPYDMNGDLGSVDRNSYVDLKTVNVAEVSITGSPTTTIGVSGNLPSQETGVATPGGAFLSSAEFYSPLGAASRMQFSWQPSATANQWQLTVSDDQGLDFGQVTAEFHDSGALAGAPLAYSGATSLAPAPAGFAFDPATGMATVTINNGTTPQVIEVNLGAPDTFDGMTQFSGDYSPLDVDSDGSLASRMVRTEYNDRGDIFGVFDNGDRRPLFNTPLAVLTNPNAMQALDGNAYRATQSSGPVSLGTAGEGGTGGITPGTLETSNVEITEELTDLIKTQRAYSSSAKIVTTVDEMLDETMRLKR
ncbi:flagellar hook protein [Brevirhabdus pacifica]|uniref:Flagellar hook protein FlgE n=1 Tax=Brevirhabdus pacifica TaxID=1267768 RepID=A0A1U7DGX0_9RHOB|nr:flagellar hook-basal body complex protein [Brevirhabdus pacifica]APX89211.1 flagellar hook protein [Brevirhabdus pacifica]OWU76742.1 flagellar hook protein [Loktanella sp. 22II-4b]PJJ86186.1 flagellar hook protein FlgE [Brevirhabdus pacifica]